jgi:DNA replication and repair protein RecF
LSDPPPAAHELGLERITIRALRNLDHVTLEPGPRLNIITGDNGQGKTSILEAIYLCATSRSFRTPKLVELIQHGSSYLNVRAELRERSPASTAVDTEPRREQLGVRREQSLAVQEGKRILRLDGEPPSSLGYYATRSPVVVFDPQQMLLSTGPASGRRTLLDRVALFHQPVIGVEGSRYRRALQERQALLGPGSAGRSPRHDELAAFEALLATHGATVTTARRQAASELAAETERAFASIGAPELELELRYRPGGSEQPEEARRELAARRLLDRRRHRTSFGPHLDELELRLGGHNIRTVGSQGQHRAVTLALKIAELRCIARARALEPILLLDDVSSELDPSRGMALFSTLAATRCQIFLTTTRREIIVAPGFGQAERREFLVQEGRLRDASYYLK